MYAAGIIGALFLGVAQMTHWLLWMAVSYLAGSVPFGLLIGSAKGVDIRYHGSGNVGATNTGRLLGQRWGVLCFVLDLLKGTVPVLAGGWALGYVGQPIDVLEAWRWVALGAAAMVGHIYPVWLGFKGGKGVATGLGVVLGIWPVLTCSGLVAAGVWAAVVWATRYVSIASIAAAVAVPLGVLLHTLACGEALDRVSPFLITTGLLALLVAYRHRSNLVRIRQGIEPKLGQR